MPHLHVSDGTSIDYVVTGVGRPLALVHGITESRCMWDPLIGSLEASGYRVVALDLRGHGDSRSSGPFDVGSMAADVAAVLDDEGASDALLVGHSLGGAVVTACAARGTGRGVVNVDQPLALGGFQEALRQIEPALRGTVDEFEAAVGAVFDQMAGPLSGLDRTRVEELRRPRQDVVLAIWEPVLTSPLAELDSFVDGMIAGTEVPYLSLHGIDPGPDYAAWLTGRIRSATVEVWDGEGHYPHLTRPERFVERVVEFDR